ncbi:hypothetical protein KC19_VG087900 [Ceratodon purpureus]|uniref:Uncharacterized protein n=1 Tax=Ceratodon purpureus TaxID=3225 RepID=A0A8T0HNX4_CERPU|nr:hypothetical protein KC19_VG087900 [Ceratodon purpureus]
MQSDSAIGTLLLLILKLDLYEEILRPLQILHPTKSADKLSSSTLLSEDDEEELSNREQVNLCCGYRSCNEIPILQLYYICHIC